MALAIWTKSKNQESFEEFASGYDVKSITVLTRVKETVYDDKGRQAVVDKVIEEATCIAIIYGTAEDERGHCLLYSDSK